MRLGQVRILQCGAAHRLRMQTMLRGKCHTLPLACTVDEQHLAAMLGFSTSLLIHHSSASNVLDAPPSCSSAPLCRLIGAVEVTEEQPWKLVTFCVQSADDAADVSERNKGMLHAFPSSQLHAMP